MSSKSRGGLSKREFAAKQKPTYRAPSISSSGSRAQARHASRMDTRSQKRNAANTIRSYGNRMVSDTAQQAGSFMSHVANSIGSKLGGDKKPSKSGTRAKERSKARKKVKIAKQQGQPIDRQAEMNAANEAANNQYHDIPATDTSQRDQAAQAYSQGGLWDSLQSGLNDVLGIETANAASIEPTPQKGGQSWISGLRNAVVGGLQVATDPFGLIPKVSSIIGKNINNPVTSMANALGLQGLGSQAQKGGMIDTPSAPFVKDLGDVLAQSSQPDQPTGYGVNGEVFYNNNTDPGPLNSDFATPGTNFSRPGSEQAYSQGISPIAYGAAQRQETQNAGPLPTPQLYDPNQGISMAPTPGLSGPWGGGSPDTSALSTIGGGAAQIMGGVNPFVSPLGTENTTPPAFEGLTPIQPDNGTVQQFLGSGRLSGGAFSNGKGNLNLGGMMGGSSPFGSDLNSVLGQKENTQGPDLGANQTAYDQQQVYIDKLTEIENMNAPDEQKLLAYEQFKNQYPEFGKTLNGEAPISTPTANQNYNLPNTTMASNTGISTPANDLSLVKQSTKSSGKTKKSKDPYQAMIDQQNQFYQEQTDAQTQAQAKQAADRQAALQSILAGLDTQYSQTQQTGQTELDKAKQQDMLKLAGQFSFANSDPNDEQRAQYQTRMTNDYTSQLQDLIAKLAASKGQDYNSAQTNYQNQNLSADQASQATMAQLASSRQNSLSQIMQAKLAAQERQKELDAQMAQQQWSNNMASKQFNVQQANQMNSQAQSQQKYQNDLLQSILGQSANMQSGGREYAQQQANALGLGNIGQYTPDNWEQAYRKPAAKQGMINLGNGKLLDPNSGDVYDTN